MRHVNKLVRAIREADLKCPIIVAPIKNKYLILDGHHRVEALKKLGYKEVPAIIVDYFSDKILVTSWKNTKKILDKKKIIKRALLGKKFPPKTTKHIIIINGYAYHISKLADFIRSIY